MTFTKEQSWDGSIELAITPESSRWEMDLETALALRQVGLLHPEEMPQVAVDALQAGEDSPSLVLLAGLTPDEFVNARDLFDAATREMGLAVPSVVEATDLAADLIAGRVAQYDLRPRDAVAILVGILENVFHFQPPEELAYLDEFNFIGARYEAPDRLGSSEEELDGWTRRLLADHSGRRPR